MKKPKSYWPIGIAATLLSFIVFLISTLIFAIGVPVNLVDQQYYHQAVDYQQHLDKMQRTADAPFRIRIVQAGNGAVTLSFDGPADQQQPQGNIMLFRPSDANLDVRLPLQLSASGKQLLNTDRLKNGLWQVKVEYSWNKQAYFVQAPISVATVNKSN